MQFRFHNTEILFLLVLIPVAILVFYLNKNRKKKLFEQFGEISTIKSLIPNLSEKRPGWKFVIWLMGFTVVILMLARPQFGTKLMEMKREGLEIIIALDVSNSMLAEDIQPNRLARAKQAISKLVDRLENDRIGLIVFAGEAYTQLPITTDYVSAKMFLSSINTNIVPVQGTAIGSAIELGLKSFTPETESSKVMVIITDGENHEENTLDIAKKAAAQGVVVYTVGMGSAQGALIPLGGNGNNFLMDKNGEMVVSKVDEQMLNKIAIAGGGRYIPANIVEVGLNVLIDEVDKLNRAEYDANIYADYDEKFQYFGILALVLLILELLVLEKKNKYLSKIKLF